MKVYRTDNHQINKPAKGVEYPSGFEVTSNDGTVRIELRHVTVNDGSMESSFYHTVTWVKEGTGWIEVSNAQTYRSKEEFLNAIKEAEGFTQAYSELTDEK